MTLPNRFRAPALLLALSIWACDVVAEEAAGVSGDVGAGVATTRNVVRGARSSTDPVPYLNGEAGPFFARIDTFGVKTLPIGAGHLELVGQWRNDGYSADGLARRRSSVPLGIGTLQVTPYGAFLATALHDFGPAHGSLLQLIYAVELDVGESAIYPEIGVERQSKDYVRYYFAPRPSEAVTGYRASSALNPFVGALVEGHVAGHWYVNTYLRGTLLDRGVGQSPLVGRRGEVSALIALAYRL